jgi:hypothetical protein
MSRSTLRFLAVVLTGLIVVVLFAGLDALPRGVRAQIDGDRAALASAQTQLRSAQDEVNRESQAQPDLFRAVAATGHWTDHFGEAAGRLQYAARDMEDLGRIEKQNRRQDRQTAERLLSHERDLRAKAVAEASGVQKEAAQWGDWKRQLPQTVEGMERDHQAIHAFDLAPVAATVQKAETDWPEKKADLDARLAALHGAAAQSDSLWQSTDAARRQVAASNYAGVDFAVLLAAADSLKSNAATLPQKTAELNSLSGQLYDSWDKLLVDMEVRGIGNAREYDQQIRTVRTHLTDVSAKTGATTSEEKWAGVPQTTYEAMRNDLGMAIEHKPAGRYDSESEHVAQPAGFAYMAPPTQASNQYGYWEHRDGRSFWVFYGQYALMRDLLFNHGYQPVERGEWEGYRTYQGRGQTYYGQDPGASAPKYGSQGTATQNRYSGSTYAQGGGFRDSQYASKPGGYRDSKYASPMARDPNGDHSPKRFGSGRRPEEPRASPPSRPSYRPAPRPMPSRPPMRSPGRSFGRRH